MRRIGGTGLVENEYRALAAALRLSEGGQSKWRVSDLIKALADQEPERKLPNEATVYRITDRMVKRGWFKNQWSLPEGDGRPYRVFWFTDSGRKEATEQVSAHQTRRRISWVDLPAPTGDLATGN